MRQQLTYLGLVLRALFELVRYDLIHTVCGFGPIRNGLIKQATKQAAKQMVVDADCERIICDAVLLATCLYWKPVLCLQRSVCAVRLLRSYGIPAKLVIGYRPAPFLSHAWVEVDGRVVNSSPGYKQRLRVLCTV